MFRCSEPRPPQPRPFALQSPPPEGPAITTSDPSRRHFPLDSAGIGSVALAWMLSRGAVPVRGDGAASAASSLLAGAGAANPARSLSPALPPHHTPKAKNIIQIFCCGGVSHTDTFDYKPELFRKAAGV